MFQSYTSKRTECCTLYTGILYHKLSQVMQSREESRSVYLYRYAMTLHRGAPHRIGLGTHPSSLQCCSYLLVPLPWNDVRPLILSKCCSLSERCSPASSTHLLSTVRSTPRAFSIHPSMVRSGSQASPSKLLFILGSIQGCLYLC